MRVALALILTVLLALPTSADQPFQFTGVISYRRDLPHLQSPIIAVQNETDAVILWVPSNTVSNVPLECGVRASFSGTVKRTANGKSEHRIASCRVLGRVEPPNPRETTIEHLLNGEFDNRLTRFSGMLRDVAISETSQFWVILAVYDGAEGIFISVPVNGRTVDRLNALIGSRVSVQGVCVPFDSSNRFTCGRTFKVAGEDDIRPISANAHTAGIPDLGTIRASRLRDFLSLGRHTASGRVLATWDGNRVLLMTDDGKIVGIELSDDRLPRFDEGIRAVGLPESDLFRINLVKASWTSVAPPREELAAAKPTAPSAILPHRNGYALVNSDYHGRAISLVGQVRSIPGDESHRLYLECDNALVPVDYSCQPALPSEISVGCTLRVSGTCVITHEERHQFTAFPRLKDFLIVLRTPKDIEVIARTPWWTPSRLIGVIGLMFLALGGIFIWNRSLMKMADRRSRELLRERLAHVESELKVGERTRLSVELHDALSQNLLGASMELNTAEQLVTQEDALLHLGIASKTLRASRDELRNCLWDLRSKALEEPDMNAAIRKTLEPYVSDISLMIRFNVPRTLFTDNTAHALMRIIRELVLNAIRHGHARTVKIAGSRENGQLLFSVRDDGCGFDPSAVPGIGQGHFGLQGVRERMRHLKGSVDIESASGAGTYVSARFPLPDDETERI